MTEHDLVQPIFIEDTSVSPSFTRWFPTWVWFAWVDGTPMWLEWAIGRWKITTGALHTSDEMGGFLQVGDTTHRVERQLRRFTPGNVERCDISATASLIPRAENIPI